MMKAECSFLLKETNNKLKRGKMKYNILFLITVLSLQHLVYAQENINQKFMSEKLFANGKEYTFDAIESIEDKVPTKNFKTKSTADWQTIMTEDFEGTFPSGDWNVYFNDGYTNAYWGKTFFQTSQVAWCAAAGTQASTWENGYLDNMRTWMIYGPFDLSDATDATLEFQYFNSSEQDFDYFKWFASTNGSNFFGYQVSGYSSNYQFTTINFDLKSIPTLGNVTGNSNVYIAFLFESDSTVVDFEGAFVDSISLRKFVETSSSIPTVTTNSATNVTENSATLNGTVNPNNSSTTVIFEYGTSASYGTEITATPSPVDGNSNSSVSANLSGLQSNTTYHYRVRATNSVGISGGTDVTFTTSQSSSNTISLNNNFTFNDPTQSSSYRMIGLPGDNNLPPTQLISGTHKTDWNMFYDNGAAENYFEEYDGSTTFNFAPGRGFWVLSKNTISINTQVNSVTLAGDDTYSINLHNGWNIITNPFDESVSLDDIKNVNVNLPANVTLWKFNGNFSQSASLDPYEGYYFDNENNLASLKIPLFSIIILPKANEQTYYISPKNLTLKLSTDEFSSMVKIGFDPSSSNDYDEMDYKIPPGDFEDLRINIVNDNFSTSHKQLFIEHRPQVGEGQKFDLQMKNNTNKKADLIVEGIEKYEDYETYLVDARLKKFYNLKEVNEIEISKNYQSNEFSLLIGNINFINKYENNSIPTEFALYQNYPNPFNPSTFIRYQIPGEMHVSIKIFDVLGNLIKTLVNEVKNEGYYENVWDASNQPSGVYFYQIKTTGFTETKKMLLIK